MSNQGSLETHKKSAPLTLGRLLIAVLAVAIVGLAVYLIVEQWDTIMPPSRKVAADDGASAEPEAPSDPWYWVPVLNHPFDELLQSLEAIKDAESLRKESTRFEKRAGDLNKLARIQIAQRPSAGAGVKPDKSDERINGMQDRIRRTEEAMKRVRELDKAEASHKLTLDALDALLVNLKKKLRLS
jgi:hypothetical protein